MARARRQNAVSVIEAAYAPESTDGEWLTGMLAAAAPDLGAGFSLCAYVYDASALPLAVSALVAEDVTVGDLMRGAIAMGSLDADYVERTWRSQAFTTVSQTVNMAAFPPAQPLIAAGIHDILVINSYDPSGLGVWIGAPLPRARKPTRDEDSLWRRVSSHIGAALRLRRGRTSAEAAVLTPDGRLHHAERDASDAETRDRLRDAVVHMERARGPLRRRDPERAVASWRAMVDARWTLIDRFERGGRRYVIAVENHPVAPGPAALTLRERQILAAAASGRTNKLVAYELGLADSTVRVLLGRAARKLGVTRRRELIALYRAHRDTAD